MGSRSAGRVGAHGRTSKRSTRAPSSSDGLALRLLGRWRQAQAVPTERGPSGLQRGGDENEHGAAQGTGELADVDTHQSEAVSVLSNMPVENRTALEVLSFPCRPGLLREQAAQLRISHSPLSRAWRAGRRTSSWRCWSRSAAHSAATWASCSAARGRRRGGEWLDSDCYNSQDGAEDQAAATCPGMSRCLCCHRPSNGSTSRGGERVGAEGR